MSAASVEVRRPRNKTRPTGRLTPSDGADLRAGALRLVAQGKPLRQGTQPGDHDEPGPETGLPLAEAARWLCEMGLAPPESGVRRWANERPVPPLRHSTNRSPTPQSAGLAYNVSKATVTGNTGAVTASPSGAAAAIGSVSESLTYSAGTVGIRPVRPQLLRPRQHQG